MRLNLVVSAIALSMAIASPVVVTPSIASALRGRSVATEDTAKPAVADFGNDNYLDIPAFLRRQAD